MGVYWIGVLAVYIF